ncbi:NUDIX domain-containing protein [Streptomyces sp. NPDC088922]|uniref:NUDIX domain-containing protein n=1 Tax=Streptomyces sp. NPDC088922 TaxID=3156671 RepID=UPI00344F3A45
MHSVRRSTHVHPAFENAAASSGVSLPLASDRAAGEPLKNAAWREAEEETGVCISVEQQEFCGLIDHHESADGPDRITVTFAAQSWAGEPHNAEPDKHEGLFWVSMEKPPPDCHPYTTSIFHMITHGPSCRALNRPTQGGSE